MTSQLPTVGRRGTVDPNNYVSHCKLCRRAIVKNRHQWVWSANPLGLVHVRCPEWT